MNGVMMLQRIADHLNWLTDDEKNSVRDDYNKVVGLYMALERTLHFNGFEDFNIVKKDAVKKKSVVSFMDWHDNGRELAHDYLRFLVGNKWFNYVSKEDEYTLHHGWSKINGLNYAVIHMDVIAVKNDV